MKWILIVIGFLGVCPPIKAQKVQLLKKPDAKVPIQTVELSCGECKFGLKGKSCDLAVRFNGAAYFADNILIDDFGDAHADDGFCNAIRKAQIQGKLIDNRLKVSYIKLLENKKPKE